MAYHRTLLTIEILGNEPWDGDFYTLAADVTDGDFSGAVLTHESAEIDKQTAAHLLLAQGSDPNFLDVDFADE